MLKNLFMITFFILSCSQPRTNKFCDIKSDLFFKELIFRLAINQNEAYCFFQLELIP